MAAIKKSWIVQCHWSDNVAHTDMPIKRGGGLTAVTYNELECMKVF
jgi:hypothetical protein